MRNGLLSGLLCLGLIAGVAEAQAITLSGFEFYLVLDHENFKGRPFVLRF
jgi:hypothetical protein